MSLTPRDFKAALRRWPSGVVIVTAWSPEGPAGMTASSFFSASLEPALIGVCIDDKAATLAAIVSSGVFGVHLLASDQADLSERFATPGNESRRFDGLNASRAASPQAPPIEGALFRLVCELEHVHPAGDHRVCLGRVASSLGRPGHPLVFHASAYHRLSPLPRPS